VPDQLKTTLAAPILSFCFLIPLALMGQDHYPMALSEVHAGHTPHSSGITEHDIEVDPLIQDIVNQTNLDSLIACVRILSGEDSVWINGSKVRIRNRVSALGNDLAADYIKNKLLGYHLDVHDQVYSAEGRNIYAIQPGILYPEKQYILCAHYDAVDDYCADDNASGVAAVLEAARLLSSYRLKYTLVYACWDQEEIGMVGSNYYASTALASQTDIRGVLNMDMIGWDGNEDRLVEIHSKSVASSDSLASLLLMNNSLYDINLNPVIHNPGTTQSDQSAFWNNGYGAIMLIEAYYGGDFNPYYHSSEDRIDQFSLDYFHDLSKLSIGTISSLVGFLEDILIVVVGPDSCYRGYTAAFTIQGVHTSFLDNGGTPAVWLSHGPEEIMADSVSVESETSLTAFFSIPAEASTDLWDVNVETAASGLLTIEGRIGILPAPALIAVSEDTINLSVGSGWTQDHSLVLYNHGASDLRFDISSQQDALNVLTWLSVESDSGICHPGSSFKILVHADARELEPGAYSGLLVVSSNDPFNPVVNIPVNLSVTPSTGTANAPGDPAGLSMYPNPVEGLLNIESDCVGAYSVEMNTLNGQLIYRTERAGKTTQIDMTRFGKGIYFVTVTSEGSVRTGKIIKLF
jgi:hypothetical protein